MAKLVKGFSFVAAVALLVVGVSVSAQTTTFTRDLTIGATGADVIALQDILIAGGYLTMPAGVSKGYFGELTKTAVMAWQAKVGLPATGYFGPMSKAKIAGTTTGSTPGSTVSTSDLEGGDGDFNDFDVLGNPDEEDVEEGETVEVLAFEFEADDSDLMIERVSLELAALTGSTTKPWRVLEEISVSVDGEEVATVDASDESEWDEESEDEYSIDISKVNYKAEEGETTKVVVSVTASDSIDTEDLGDWGIVIAEDGVRALNAEGINVYEGASVAADWSTSISGDEREFSLTEVEAGTLDLAFDEDDAGNDNEDVDIDDKDETEEVVIYTFTAESEDGDVKLEEIVVTLATSTGTGSDLEDMISELVLEIDGDEISSESVSGASTASVTFEDLEDIEIGEDEEVEIVVYATVEAADDITGFSEGDGFKVTGVDVDYVDSQDDDQTEDELTNTTGGVVSLRESGLMIELSGGTSAKETFTADEAGEGDIGTYTISFKVTAGDEDVYVGGVDYSYTEATGFSTSSDFTGPSSRLQASGNYKVSEGRTETFTVTVELEAASTTANTAQKVTLDSILWSTEDVTTGYEEYTSGLDDFETASIFLRGQN